MTTSRVQLDIPARDVKVGDWFTDDGTHVVTSHATAARTHIVVDFGGRPLAAEWHNDHPVSVWREPATRPDVTRDFEATDDFGDTLSAVHDEDGMFHISVIADAVYGPLVNTVKLHPDQALALAAWLTATATHHA